ncbi:MAG: rhodanese-like domain-containing protein [Emcibacter sp.]|nr:rhodanese-like domain-containing protein [Emcibacter sp.]HEC00532.1 rhodanese-like domain-containing protein [Sphingomonadales bacterium]
MSYTGDVTVEEVWKILAENENAILVDVRTQAEWAFVGLCDLSKINKSPLLLSWQIFPQMDINADFVRTIVNMDIPKDSPLYFLCRSGVRSKAAASAMVAEGYSQCFNILEGFEGDRDAAGHRGTCGGWKAAGLPWTQS